MKTFSLIDIKQVIPFTAPKGREHDNVLIERYEHSKEERKTKGGIIVPNIAEREDELFFAKGKVLMAPDNTLDEGTFVLFSTGHGTTFRLDDNPDDDFRIVPLENISAILKESTQSKRPMVQLQEEK
jgi:co-chaperonin GroES (HSP10)